MHLDVAVCLPRESETVSLIRTVVTHALRTLGVTSSCIDDVRLALSEAATNVVVGFAFALVTQFAVFPMLGLAVSVTNNLILGCIFTTVSMVRSFTLRRVFEALRVRSLATQAGGERP